MIAKSIFTLLMTAAIAASGQTCYVSYGPYELPITNLSSSTSYVCYGAEYQYQVEPPPGSQISWSIGGGHFVGSSTTNTVAVVWDNSGPIVLSASAIYSETIPDNTGGDCSLIVNTYTYEGTYWASATEPWVLGPSSGCTSVLLTANPEGTGYQWKKDGNPISGAISRTYQAAQSGTYSVVITFGVCNWESSPFPLSLSQPSISSITSSSVRDVIPGQVTMTVSGVGNLQWRRNGVDVPGETGITLATVIPGNYTVSSTVSNCVVFTPNSINVVGNDNNFRILNSVTVPSISTEADFLSLIASNNQFVQDIEYLNQGGMPYQQLSRRSSASPTPMDIVQPIAYDELGRSPRTYLPYGTSQTSGFSIAPASALTDQQSFYNNPSDKIPDDTPWSEVVYDNSPLSRILKQGAVGAKWQPTGQGTPRLMAYGSNASDVRQWSIVGGLPISTSAWSVNWLARQTDTDEQGNISETYTSQDGLKILSRHKVNATDWAETYYVYDGQNRLRFILPPELISQLGTNYAPTQTQVNAWAFQTLYDDLGREVEQKGPGSDWIFTVYDSRDRVVLTQDGRQRITNEWSYVKYDGLNRPVISGIYRPGSSISRTTMQQNVDALDGGKGYQCILAVNTVAPYTGALANITVSAYAGVNEYVATQSVRLLPGFTFTAGVTASTFRSAIVPDGGIPSGSDVFPSVDDEALALNYYDDYNTCSVCAQPNFQFINESWTSSTNEPYVNFNRNLGQKVASSIRILESGGWLSTVSYVNRRGDVIQVIGENHLGGRDRHSTLTDFAGKVLETLRTPIGYNSGGIQAERRRNVYDLNGRLLTTYHKINNQNEVMLFTLEYNELGQMVKKNLHSADFGVTFLQGVDYRRNIRGWLTNVNNLSPADDANDYFGLSLSYDAAVPNAGSTTRLDGLISSMVTKHDLSSKRRVYNYSYDNLGRMNGAAHKMTSDGGSTWGNETDFYNEGSITYDLNGNIKQLHRAKEKFNGATYVAEWIDQLTYDYTGYGGNQLSKVIDASSNVLGFKDGTNTGNDYAYDVDGNLVMDLNKGITAIRYNQADLPSRVSFENGSYLQNTYDASGIKLREEFFNIATQTTSTRDFVGGIELMNGQVIVVQMEEGRITAPTYVNLMENRDAGSGYGFSQDGSVARGVAELNGETYVTGTVQGTSTPVGLFPLFTTNGASVLNNVKPGETYSFRVLGYQSNGTSASLHVKTNLGDLVWPGPTLPVGSGNEGWVTVNITVPAGATQLQVGVHWANPSMGHMFYINKIALYKTDLEYNYFLSDQVGSTRVVLQTTPANLVHTATMETENYGGENGESTRFVGINTQYVNASLGNTTIGGTKAIELNSVNRIGPGKSIKVYPGDIIFATASSYFPTLGGYTDAAAATVGMAVAATFGGASGVMGDPGSIYSNVTNAYSPTGIAGLSPDRGPNEPSAFLNYLLFDKDFKPLAGNSYPVSATPNVPQPVNMPAVIVNEIGYIYIYLSYDNAAGGSVFFDELKITHQESPVIQVNGYYPYGMVSYSWLREGEIENANLFQGKELISQTGWHDFGSRMYWSDLGRWFAVDPQQQFSSPYLALGNSPSSMVDPNGQFAFIPFLLSAFKIYGGVSTAYSVVNGFSNGGIQGGVQALTSATFNLGLGAIVGQLGQSLVPWDDIYGSFGGSLLGASVGAASSGLSSGFVSWATTGNFEVSGEAMIMGGITGGIAGGAEGYANVKNSKYERNTFSGELTPKGRMDYLIDLMYQHPDAFAPGLNVMPVFEKNVGWRGETRPVVDMVETSPSTAAVQPGGSAANIYINLAKATKIRSIKSALSHEVRHGLDYATGEFSSIYRSYRSNHSFITSLEMTISRVEINARLENIKVGYEVNSHTQMLNLWRQALTELPQGNRTSFQRAIRGEVDY